MGTLIPFSNAQTRGTLAGGFVRPVDAEGVLVAAADAPRTRAALWALAGEPVAEHLARVCTWRADQLEVAWRPGDYSFLVLEFVTGAGAVLYVQFWSEPEEGNVAFEVCSGAGSAAVARHMGRKRQEELRERGFEIGGGAGNFVKRACADGPAAVKSLAREALGVLCRVLGYDGTAELRYHLHLGTRLEMRPVHDGINAADLAKLLRGWDCRAEPRVDPETGLPAPDTLTCDYRGYRFLAFLTHGDGLPPGQYRVVCFRRYLADKSLPLERIAAHANANLLCIQASLDADGDLQFDQAIVVDGGVAAGNIRAQLWLWHANLESIRKLIQGGGVEAG